MRLYYFVLCIFSQDEKVQSDRNWRLVKTLQKKGPKVFAFFIEVLNERGQKFIATKLKADARHKFKCK